MNIFSDTFLQTPSSAIARAIQTDGFFKLEGGIHEDFIDKKHGQDVVSFKAPRGTLLVYDTYGIHRARPVQDANFVRKSMFFQVDSKVDSAEPILLDPRFVKDRDPKVLDYLGFGKPAEYSVYPNTDLSSLPAGRVPWGRLAKWTAMRAARPLYEAIPLEKRGRIKRLFGH
jgi:hypothetical protein